jgi:DNA-binding transcriptional ArsR family regulator
MSEVHPLLTDRTRLVIMAALAAKKDPLEFLQLAQSLSLSKGNLSSHLRKLEENGLIMLHKEFIERKPRTTVACTTEGRSALSAYLMDVEAMLKSVKKS